MNKRRSYKLVSDDDIKDMVEMYRSGKYYLREIAEWIGVSSSCVDYWLKKVGAK